MNEKYGDDDEYYGQEDPDEETKTNKNKKQGEASDIDDSDDESKQSDASDDEDGEVSEDEDYDDDDDEDARNKRLFAKEKSVDAQNYPVSDDDEDDDEEEDENYLQKFDETLKQNIIKEYHPEMQQLNYSEVELLTVIHRDTDGQIYDPLHRTLPFLTKFEKARVLGERAKQINDGAQPFVKLTTNAIDGYLIALAELEQKAIPFIIKRPLPNGGCEYWKLKDLEILI